MPIQGPSNTITTTLGGTISRAAPIEFGSFCQKVWTVELMTASRRSHLRWLAAASAGFPVTQVARYDFM